MSPERKKEYMRELPDWIYRAIIGSMLSIILYFVIDIHQDFERQKEKLYVLEKLVDRHEIMLTELKERGLFR